MALNEAAEENTPSNGAVSRPSWAKIVRAKCMDCSMGQPKEVRLCPVTKCPLWEYRMGKRPEHERRKAQGCAG